MKGRLFAYLIGIALVFLLTQPAVAAYDGAAVKAFMGKMPQLLTDLQAKSSAKDYYGAAELFMEIAKIFKRLDVIIPAKSDKATWDRNHRNLIDAAFKGIGACGARDDAAIKEAVQAMIQYRNEGHKLFK